MIRSSSDVPPLLLYLETRQFKYPPGKLDTLAADPLLREFLDDGPAGRTDGARKLANMQPVKQPSSVQYS